MSSGSGRRFIEIKDRNQRDEFRANQFGKQDSP